MNTFNLGNSMKNNSLKALLIAFLALFLVGTSSIADEQSSDCFEELSDFEIISKDESEDESIDAKNEYKKEHPSETFTLFFRGTGSSSDDAHNFDRFKEGELISTLFNNAKNHIDNKESMNVLSIDGPGSGNKDINTRFKNFTNEHYYNDYLGKGLGSGLYASLDHAMAVITRDNYNPAYKQELGKLKHDFIKGKIKTIKRVNLIGWSRGAVAAILMAHRLNNNPRTSHLEVNIFAVDPVAGFARDYYESEIYQLPPNVREFVEFLAEDDFSFGFTPILPQAGVKTKRIIQSLPGFHATLVGEHSAYLPNQVQESNLYQVGQLVRHFAEVFLKKHGTKLSKNLNYSTAQVADLYNSIDRQRENYRLLQKKSYLGFRSLRTLASTFYSKSTGLRRVASGRLWSSQLRYHKEIHRFKNGLNPDLLDLLHFKYVL